MGNLLQSLLHDSKSTPAAIPAIPAIQGQGVAVKIAESQESQGMAAERTTPATIRARLLALAEFECLEPALVHRLDDADLAACTGLGDEVLTAYLRALDAAARMDAGMAPTGWTAARYCRLCGPVLLWPDCPPIVLACPWCFRRKAGRYVPRPQVQCAECVHFIRNEWNPAGGGGDCAKDRGGHYPKQRHRCDGFEPAEVATMVSTGNTKKRHRKESR